ncbi:glycosyltransferase family 15 protein [Armillaria luteobubalina]|uniref:Glycosyltransferase family 15 protein n=1 Tax=Armillaria luteobubalina TaxID=153913 RepID=A0AA39UAA2_9AGAR|nr:glycosyltransferase family 15 protein [Armillaria luteobubalina]
MNTTARYLLLILGVVISVHYILSFTHQEYGRITSLDNIVSHFHGSSETAAELFPVPDEYFAPSPNTTIQGRRANATFVILARNTDLQGVIGSIREIEDRFNRQYNYPYVLLNEEEFTEEFKRRVSVLTASKMEFGLIPREHWFQPDSIDEERAKASRDQMVAENVIYGGSVSYRNMCRFNSGFFFKHPLMEQYRWYWRVEPDVHFHCDVNFDPFVFMEDNDKIYAFTITMYEFERTIPTLWSHVRDFVDLHPEYVVEDNAMGFQSDNGGLNYNLCHFWSNFEIADMRFWRGPAYQAFFEYLDSKGGFYYERWGDAPVHSIAAALFARKNQLQFFDEIGYEHNPYTHCPRKEESWRRGKCSCDQKKSFDYDGYSCMRRWDRLMEA